MPAEAAYFLLLHSPFSAFVGHVQCYLVRLAFGVGDT